MTIKIVSATVAALIALTSAASATTFYTDSQRDAALREQANRVQSSDGYVTTPAIDPAYSERDARLQAQSEGNGAGLITTHGERQVYVTKPAIDPAYSQRDLRLQNQANGNGAY